MRRWVLGVLAVSPAAALLAATPTPAARTWLPADKEGFATATAVASPVWLTLRRGSASELFWPDLGTPAARSLELTVDGRRAATAPGVRRTVGLADDRSLSYVQTLTRPGRWHLTQRWATDPARATMALRVTFTALDRRARRLGLRYDPALRNGAGGDRGRRAGRTLVAADGRRAASALRARPALSRLRPDIAGRRDVVQTARLGRAGTGARRATVVLGFGRGARAARRTAGRTLRAGFARTAARYAAGWHRYLDSLTAAPAAAAPVREAYDASLMVLKASEDKRHRGASVASPSMPWAWGLGEIEQPSGAYHLVWSRDLYQVATAHLASGDRAAAERNLSFLFERQQKPDGSFPQNSEVDGTPHWTKLQLDEVAFPLVLAWQLGRDDARTFREHVRPAADLLARRGPKTEQERWENQSGYSPSTLAASIAGLICAADLARRVGDLAAAERWEATADRWNANVERWTLTTNGRLSDAPYYLRVTKDGEPNAGTEYDVGDSGPAKADQRGQVDPSFLELVRLGLRRADDPRIADTMEVVDRVLGVDTPNGRFWHRFTSDGYGERRDGGPWEIGTPNTFRTFGRVWPIFAGERGEAEVAAGRLDLAAQRLAAMAAAGNDGRLIPEQVWDDQPPAGRPGLQSGEGTFSATPLAWSHAQLVRLAWAIDAGAPVETPSIVACRYLGERC